MTLEALHQAFVMTYTDPIQKMIDSRARYYLWLSEKDLFSLSEADAKKHQEKLTQLSEEIQTLDAVRSAITDLNEVYSAQFERLNQVANYYRSMAIKLSKDVDTLQTIYANQTTENDLISIAIETIQRNKQHGQQRA